MGFVMHSQKESGWIPVESRRVVGIDKHLHSTLHQSVLVEMVKVQAQCNL